MTPLRTHEIAGFLKRFRFRGGRLLRMRLNRVQQRDPEIELIVYVRQAIINLGEDYPPVRLRLRLKDVSEFRFQKRPNSDRTLIGKFDLSFIDGRCCMNLNSYLNDDEKPELIDYRASDLYFVCSELNWEVVTKPPEVAS